MCAYDNATVMGISGVRKGGEFDVRTRHWTVYGSASGFMETHQRPKPRCTRHTESDIDPRVQVAFRVACERRCRAVVQAMRRLKYG
jgi:hypothetical protein